MRKLALFLIVSAVVSACFLGGGSHVSHPTASADASTRFGAGVPYAYPVGPAIGDLCAQYPNPVVCGLQSRPVSDAAPTAGQVLQWDGGVWGPATLSFDGGLQTRAYYGSMVDGSVHLTVSTSTFNGGTCTTGACTLSRTAAYATLTIDSGVTLATAGFGIYYDTLALAGTITDDGAAASGNSGGAGAAHGEYGGGTAGGAGDTVGTGGGNGTSVSGENVGFGGVGGSGAAGTGTGATAGGTGGSVNNGLGIVVQSIPSVDYLSAVVPGIGSPTSSPSPVGIHGGTGGGGGGCSGPVTSVCSVGGGGGGGGGGGSLLLSGRVRTGAGAIHARGGAGALGTGGGPGGGGAGGIIVDICGSTSGYTGTIDESGGAAGGSGATAGATGQYIFIQG